MNIEALKRISGKLRKAGATLPAPEVTGTIEGSMVTGLCVALTIVEQEIEALADQPAQRTWVGLTDEDIKAVNAQVLQIPPSDYTTTTYAKAIEAKLMEKNT